jgi:hypothetical protein
MALSAFDDKSREPNKAMLTGTLGRSAALWEALVDHLATEYQPLSESWNFAGAKYGWSYRAQRKKRTILYLTPCKKYFLAGFALGEKAVRAAHAAKLPKDILAAIDAAPKYAEGRGIRLEVRYKRDLDGIKKLAAIKMAN